MILLVHILHHTWVLLLTTHIHSVELVHLSLVHLLLLLTHATHHTRVLSHLLILHEIIASHEALILVHAHTWLLHALEVWHESICAGLESLTTHIILRSPLETLVTLSRIKPMILLRLELHLLLRLGAKSRVEVQAAEIIRFFRLEQICLTPDIVLKLFSFFFIDFVLFLFHGIKVEETFVVRILFFDLRWGNLFLLLRAARSLLIKLILLLLSRLLRCLRLLGEWISEGILSRGSIRRHAKPTEHICLRLLWLLCWLIRKSKTLIRLLIVLTTEIKAAEHICLLLRRILVLWWLLLVIHTQTTKHIIARLRLLLWLLSSHVQTSKHVTACILLLSYVRLLTEILLLIVDRETEHVAWLSLWLWLLIRLLLLHEGESACRLVSLGLLNSCWGSREKIHDITTLWFCLGCWLRNLHSTSAFSDLNATNLPCCFRSIS